MWCCVGGEYCKIIWFYQLGWECELATVCSFRISLPWPIHIINPVDKTKLSFFTVWPPVHTNPSPQNGASNWRNLETLALIFHVDGKHLKTDFFLNDVVTIIMISLPAFLSHSNPNCIFVWDTILHKNSIGNRINASAFCDVWSFVMVFKLHKPLDLFRTGWKRPHRLEILGNWKLFDVVFGAHSLIPSS